MPQPLLVLVDGSSYFYRAFHALPPLTNSKGEPTGAVYGVVSMLQRLLKDYSPERIAVVFDAPGKTFRDTLYADYKATREATPEDLRAQFPQLLAVIEALGLPVLQIPDVEADDVIATLVKMAVAENLPVVISTGDKDMAQLVNEHVTLINTMSNTQLDSALVEQKFGVKPEQMVDYLTLIGDKVDNIPGVDKVGPKTAAKWLQQYQTLDNLFTHAADISGKVGENLRAAMRYLPLSKQLITLKNDVPLPVTLSALQKKPTDHTRLIDLYRQLEFKSWLNALLVEQPAASISYQLILQESHFQYWLKQLQQADRFAIDTETNSLNYMQAEIIGLSFALDSGEAAYLPLAHDYPEAPQQLSRSWALERLRSVLEDPKIAKIGQNLKYDKAVFANHGIELNGIAFDTMLESYVLNSTAVRHDMDSLALKYLGRATTSFESIAGKGAKQRTFNEIDVNIAKDYAAEDAEVTLALHHKLWPKLQQEKSLADVLQTIEMPLVSVLASMERAGVMLDEHLLEQQSKQLAIRLEELAEQAYELAGDPFNLNSTKQLQEILFDVLQLPVLEKTPKGAPSTAESVLSELALDYPLPKILLEYRSLSKLKSTYTDALPQQINKITGRVHTSYHQAATSTGRLASANPNLQNIPIRTAEGRKIRQAFIAPKQHVLVAADYSQIELRIMAHLSEDSGLQTAFAQGIDIHRATAAEVFATPLTEVTDTQRRNAKAINFGLIYGMSAYGLARQLAISREAAQTYIDKYFERYPGVLAYMERSRNLAKQQGYVETLFGRRLYLPEINAQNLMRRRAAERLAINAPMQGTAADIIKRAMIAIDNWLQQSQLAARMIMQVHDELIFEVRRDALDDLLPQVRQRMEQAAELAVPLQVAINSGNNWDEAH